MASSASTASESPVRQHRLPEGVPRVGANVASARTTSSVATLVDGFAEWVRRAPDALAVSAGDQDLTYLALDRRANAVAHAIVARNPPATAPVAIVLGTGVDVIVAMIGVLKAGHFYVVLDPAHPPHRNSHIIADAKPGLMLTHGSHATIARRLAGATTRVLVIDELAAAMAEDAPDVRVAPDDLAWLIYTSGSTGKPKGVIQSHRHAVHNVLRQQPLARWAPSDRMTWLYSPGVMGATRALTAAVLNGLALFPRDPRQDAPATLIRWLRDERITIFHSVASLFRTVFEAEPAHAPLQDIRLVMFGGERVTATELALLRSHFPASCRVYTGLGTTETGTVSHALIDPHRAIDAALPLGTPVEGVQVTLEDENGRPVPRGEIGEIVVTSPHLALGYWGAPTAPSAFANSATIAGARVYRTGDLARYDASGQLWHAGRKDFEIKIRGFRVALAEIETALQQHPAVRDAVVVGQPGRNGDTMLVAYCVSRDGPKPSERELRAFLEPRLPAHMLPGAFVFLATLPRTPNGKLDRRALPRPQRDEAGTERSDDTFATSMEKTLATIWQAVLGAERVSRADNFFARGGHSLAAMQVVARLHAALGIEVPPAVVFQHPVLADLAVELERLAARAPADDVPLQVVPRDTDMPLSFAQERLWFLAQWERASSAYHIARAFRLRGRIDVGMLQSGLTAIVARHEGLRTVFVDDQGEPRARIQPPRPFVVRTVDLSAADDAGSIARFAQDEAERPFDLQADVLLRAAIGLRAEDDAVLVLTVHHLAADGWSLGLLLRELSALARAPATAGATEATLPVLEVQYADFVHWQRARLGRDTVARQLAFWRNTLAGAPPVIELPTDFARPAAATGRGAVHTFRVAPHLVQAMAALARDAGVTPFVAWFSAFAVLLHRHQAGTDLVIAAPVSGRSRVALEPLIGLFVNTLVFRADLAGDPSFRAFLARFGRHAAEVFAQDELPFEKLVQELQPPRSAAYAPIAQVMFAWQNTPRAELDLPQITAEPLPLEAAWSKFDLTLSLEADGDALRGSFEYSTDLFRPETIAALAERFVTVVGGIIAAPDTGLSALPLLPAAERERLRAWSGAEVRLAPAATVLDAFRATAARTPAAVAVRAGDAELTYQQLADAARNVAHQLRRLRVAAGAIVGICLDRSIEFAAALLGVLHVGGAFLPLDPDYPAARLDVMVSDACAAALIVAQRTRHLFPGGRPQLEFGTRTPPATDAVALGPEELHVAAPADRAYVLYTSGSTGRPKGVAVPHRALWQHNVAVGEAFALGPHDRVLQFAALSFDVALEEIFPAWMFGATVVFRRGAAAPSLAELLAQVVADRITVLNLPTAFWREWVAALATHPVPASVRLVIIGGEKATLEDLRRWQQHVGPHVRLLNGYGPTEATITATLFDATTFAGNTPSGSVPIGRPVAGTRAYVLDGTGQLAPIGVWGELHLGGACLAEAYLNQPDATAAAFVADPFADEPGARMYRTGDFVRWTADGQLEFRGRRDDQVKWRGFRIELGEIEAALRRIPGVTHAAARLLRDARGDARLVSYVSPAAAAAKPDDLLAQLRHSLPSHFVPADIVGIDAWPLTPSGKVDLAALPSPADPNHMPTREAPEFTSFEARLREVWEEVLGVTVSAPEQSFFALGGHSLLAVRLMARVRATFGTEVPLATLFAQPTLRAFAATLEARRKSDESPHLLTLKAGRPENALVFVPGAGAGLLWGYRNLANHFPGDAALHVLAPDTKLEPGAATSVEDLAARYVARLRAFQPRGPYRLAGYCFGGNVAYEMARQLTAAGERVALLAVFDSAPSNSEYYRVRFNRQFVVGFVRNLALAAAELAGLSRAERRDRLTLLRRKAGGVLARRLGLRPAALTELERQELELDEMLPDRTLYPPEELELWRAHLQMMAQYRPQPSAVRVVLFRTRRRPLWRSHEPSLGWSALARDGVELETVAGTHSTLFREPHVGSLAARVAARLDPRSGPHGRELSA